VKVLGSHPADGLPVYAVRSPFGAYIQHGDARDDSLPPNGCWLPKNVDIREISLDSALAYLGFPRILGFYPNTDGEISVCLEPYGIMIRGEALIHGELRPCCTRLPDKDDPLTITLERAVEILDGISKRTQFEEYKRERVACEYGGCNNLATAFVSIPPKRFCLRHAKMYAHENP
jgi:topoisomerase IA-like protein